jgi:hypothetical protein
MKLLTFPVKLLVRLVVLPVKVVLAIAGLTFRAGFKAGTLPVKGGAVAVRTLGFKAVVLFATGVALGVYVGRRLGGSGVELAEASYPADFGTSVDRSTSSATNTVDTVEDELEAAIDHALGVTGGELAVDAVDDGSR